MADVVAFAYHDVLPVGAREVSGFTGADAATYLVELPQFQRQLDALALDGHVSTVDTEPTPLPAHRQCLLTFDDGGESAHSYIAGELEARGWRGCFFVTTSLIGSSGFLRAEQILDLHKRGHVIGSHSVSHRGRMSRMPRERVRAEWQGSADLLAGIVGEPITAASIPSGYYAPHVAEEAAAAGIRFLYTQKPTTRPVQVDGCLVLGRYTVRRWTAPATIAALANGELGARAAARAVWFAKQIPKALPGSGYARVRGVLFRAAHKRRLTQNDAPVPGDGAR